MSAKICNPRRPRGRAVEIEFLIDGHNSATTSVTITSDDPAHPNPIVVTIKGEK